MPALSFNLQRIIEHDGVGIAVTGMLIVFCALVLVSVFIAGLPRALDRLAVWFPEVDHAHGPAGLAPGVSHSAEAETEDELLAALALALHLEQRTTLSSR